MALTSAMATLIAGAINGTAITPAFNNANTYIGVGDSSAAFAVGQTDLQAATNKVRKVMDATFPQIAGNVITYQATFSTAEANFAWNEWGVFNASAAGTMLNRKVESLGTKTSASSWQLNVAITVSA